jgi:1-acyl-sn-glycerol-3-phosphate acyltransferase
MTAGRPHTEPGWTLYARAVAFLARQFVRVQALGRVRVEGLRDVPREGPMIVIANHISNLDPPLVAGWLAPALRRRPHLLAKDVLFVGPVGLFLRSIGVIPVKVGGSDIEAYRKARTLLDAGSVVVIFPEGTRSADGILGEPKPGVALLASRTGVPILPVGVSNTDRLLGRGRLIPRFGTRVTVRFGAPFTLVPDPALPRREALQAASDEMMRSIAALTDKRHRGRWGDDSPT